MTDFATPDPLAVKFNGSVARLGSSLDATLQKWADGAAFTNGNAFSVVIALAGILKGRFRFKTATSGGTLSSRFLREDKTTAYAAATAPSDVSVTAGTEAVVPIDDLHGESFLQITFTPGGNGTITYADLCRL